MIHGHVHQLSWCKQHLPVYNLQCSSSVETALICRHETRTRTGLLKAEVAVALDLQHGQCLASLVCDQCIWRGRAKAHDLTWAVAVSGRAMDVPETVAGGCGN